MRVSQIGKELQLTTDPQRERLEQTLDKLNDNLTRIRTSINDIKADIEWVFEEMKDLHPDLLQEGNMYDIDLLSSQNDLRKLKGETAIHQRPQEDINDLKSMFAEDSVNKEDCKKLFREIAKKCHTDVSDGKDEYFLRAQKAYNNGDYSELMDIDKAINENKEIPLEDLKAKIDRVHQEVQRKFREQSDWQNKVFYHMAVKHKSKKPSVKIQAKQMFVNHMYKQMAKTLNDKEIIDEEIIDLTSFKK